MLRYPGRSVNNSLCLTQHPGQVCSFVLGSVPEEIITNPGMMNRCVLLVIVFVFCPRGIYKGTSLTVVGFTRLRGNLCECRFSGGTGNFVIVELYHLTTFYTLVFPRLAPVACPCDWLNASVYVIGQSNRIKHPAFRKTFFSSWKHEMLEQDEMIEQSGYKPCPGTLYCRCCALVEGTLLS